MKILVMQDPWFDLPVERWILDAAPDAELRILSAHGGVRADADMAPGVRRILVDGDYAGDATTAALFTECAEWRPDVVYGNSEFDTVRAAEARTAFGIAGIPSTLALAFRDKVRMKSLYTGLSISPPAFRAVQCLDDVLAAQRAFGTVVVKPRQGMASAYVLVLRSADEIRELFGANPALIQPLTDGMALAEQYISGDVYHVDALVDGDRVLMVSPSVYTTPPHLFRERSLGSIMLEPGSPDHRRLTAFTKEFVGALPAGHGVTVLHMELFKDVTGRFWAGEVACRTGGDPIGDSLTAGFGINVNRYALLLATGLGADLPPITRQDRHVGYVLWTGPEPFGAEQTGRSWVLHSVSTGRTEAAAESQMEARGRIVLEGRDYRQVCERIEELLTGAQPAPVG